ncbi:MAG: glycosyltransferase family 4 protein [Bacteroidetes bacterium]|nr:glycosyltransferase family 4 protein [Bacteroidota bacterium]
MPKQFTYSEEHLISAIEKYIIKNKIRVVFCEYGPSGVMLMPVCKKLNLPLIVHFHGYDAFRDDILNSYGKHYTELFKIAKGSIVVSNDMKQQLINLGCSPDKLHLLPYGIDSDFYKSNPLREKIYDLVYCGRFVAKKSPLKIIEAFHAVVKKKPNCRLAMIGDGELLDPCKSMAHKLKLDKNIDFLGALKAGNVVEIYQKSRILVNHSVKTNDNDSEGTPLTILEAMSCGLVVVASDHAGIKDVIINNENGFIIPENNWQLFASKLTEVVTDITLHSEISNNAIRTIQENYKLSTYLDNISKIIEKYCN